MDCPSCHAENASQAVACAACGRSLPSNTTEASADRPARRSGSRRRNVDPSEVAVVDTTNPAARRAYRVALWSILPGFGLLLGPAAMVLGCLAVRDARDDLSASNRAKAAVLFGTGSTITQWLGAAMMYYGWTV